MHAGIRVCGLYGVRQDVGVDRAGTTRDEDNGYRWGESPQSVQAVQTVHSTVVLHVAG